MLKRRNLLFILLLINLSFFTFSVSNAREYRFHETLNWQIITNNQNYGNGPLYFLTFPGAVISSGPQRLSYYTKTFNIAPAATISAEIQQAVYAPLHDSVVPAGIRDKLKNGPQIRSEVKYAAGQSMAVLRFLPFRINKENGRIEKLVSFDLVTSTTEQATPGYQVTLSKKAEEESVLAKGKWVKLGLTETGIYKLDHNYLKGLDLDIKGDGLKYLQIYGKAGGMLPQANAASRDKDLVENAIYVSDNNNQFDGGDYVLFYARGPVSWSFDKGTGLFRHQANYYCDTAYYFITMGAEAGKRIGSQPSAGGSVTNEISSYDAYDVHEYDAITEIMKYVKGGRECYGESFKSFTSNTISQSFVFNFPQAIAGESSYIKAAYAARSSTSSSFKTELNGQTVLNTSIRPADFDYYLAPYALEGLGEAEFKPAGTHFNVTATYNKTNIESEGWLNYIEMNVRSSLAYKPGQFSFREGKLTGAGVVNRYTISNIPGSGFQVWDVTDFHDIKQQQAENSSGSFSFRAQADVIREYVAHDGTGYLVPKVFGRINNQNLHGLAQAEMLIVAHKDFLPAAQRLADFHRSHDGFTVHVVTPRHIYNEFSSGAQDVSAIRDFVKMFYDRSKLGAGVAPRYLLLFGDASYDYKDRLKNNTNYVPTYEGYNSLDPQSSYASDDFFGFMDQNEGAWPEEAGNSDLMDIGIGRLPVQSLGQANNMVDKILRYHDPAAEGDWRNQLLFIADDENNSVFVQQCEQLSRIAREENGAFNHKKIYMDAYKQVSTSNGAKFPDVTNKINQTMETGALVIDYIGHGGELGLAHERIMEINDINSWTNKYKMPLFITATCELSRFDDPERTSAGELVILNPNGGAIGMFTTTRVVYIGGNQTLNVNMFNDNLLRYRNNEPPRFGDILMTGKNRSPNDNNRNFTLLGDPAIKLALPEHRIKLTSVSQEGRKSDTLRALGLVTVTGHVETVTGEILTDFNGAIYPVIFDKATSQKTLGNDPASYPLQTFATQENIIYKGQATVKNGEFTFSFVVPKDISFKYGTGKLSFYAKDGKRDAHGYDDSIVVGGSAPNPVVDDEGPRIRLFMNDTNFVRGGLVSENPVMLALVEDNIGLNTVGTGIGHELTAVLNGGEPIVLNQYYEADIDNYKRGTIRYPFYKLADGEYTISVKVWDVANNSSSASTDFIVASSTKLAIDKILNYPNPFREQTVFQFEHNRPNEDLDVYIDIYNISGQLVKRIKGVVNGAGTRSATIKWNGANDNGAAISSGLYVYQLTVRSSDGQQAQGSQKMVVIK